jgi:hypothetical protein
MDAVDCMREETYRFGSGVHAYRCGVWSVCLQMCVHKQMKPATRNHVFLLIISEQSLGDWRVLEDPTVAGFSTWNTLL